MQLVFSIVLICSKYCRRHGIFVTRHPLLVLFASLLIPILLCIGLIHFKVETRPEKVLNPLCLWPVSDYFSLYLAKSTLKINPANVVSEDPILVFEYSKTIGISKKIEENIESKSDNGSVNIFSTPFWWDYLSDCNSDVRVTNLVFFILPSTLLNECFFLKEVRTIATIQGMN